MALTRPTIYNLQTNIEVFNESMTVLNAGASSANVDVGFILNRAHGLVPNAAFYWSESTQSFVVALTSNAGITASNISVSNYGNITTGNIYNANTITTNAISTGTATISSNATVSGNLLVSNYGILWSSNGQPFSSGGNSFNPASPGTIGGTTPGAATFSSLKTTQSTVTLGTSAGAISQGTYAVGIGTYAGYNTQGAYSVVIGGQAGQNTAGAQSVLIGYNAGFNSNNANVVSIGSYAGTSYAGAGAVAIGPGAGSTNQATNAVAIGNQAGVVQSASSIILNSTGSTLNDNGITGFFVKPTRNDTGNIGNVVMYNTTTGEHTYSNTISIAGNLTVGGNIYQNNTISTSITHVLTHGSDNNFQLSAQNGVSVNTTGSEVARFGINYATVGWDSFTQYIRGSSSQNGYQTLWAGNTAIMTVQTGSVVPVANVTTTLGSSTAWWSTIYGTAIHAQYADLAENYTSDNQYPPGTVVVFGGEAEITTTDTSHDTRVAGVISTNPAYLMNDNNQGLPVALTGRVPCRVQGPVVKGQVLVTSNTPGVAQAIDNSKFLPGCVLGKALEAINTSTIATIEVVVGRF